jgi:hypothetical protein
MRKRHGTAVRSRLGGTKSEQIRTWKRYGDMEEREKKVGGWRDRIAAEEVDQTSGACRGGKVGSYEDVMRCSDTDSMNRYNNWIQKMHDDEIIGEDDAMSKGKY